MIKVEKILAKKNYICSFCGTGIGTYAIKYEDPIREAVVPVCQVCYEDLKLEMTCSPSSVKKKVVKKK